MFEHGLSTTCTITLESHHHNTGAVQQKKQYIFHCARYTIFSPHLRLAQVIKLKDFTTSHANMGSAMLVKWASITSIRTHKGVPWLSLAMSCTMLAAIQHSSIPQPLNTAQQHTSFNKGVLLHYWSHSHNYQD
jgi:hypothetical protein